MQKASFAPLAIMAVAPVLPAVGQSVTDGYLNHEALTAAVNDLDEHEQCSLDLLGASREGRGLFVLTLAADADRADQHPALLIVAGVDGRHLVGTETAVRVARTLLNDHADLLDDMTVYIVPRLNPDGAEMNFSAVNAGFINNKRVVDLDRDGAADEDGPRDLNGDGLITTMRRLNPPLDDGPTHLADPNEPRLHKTPDPLAGERATYVLYTEGLDQDGDGLIAEDGPGGVDLDRNFMHEYPEHVREAGTHPLSEPEALAFVQFVLNHRNIVSALVYGRHDNLINVPSGRGRDVTGRGPKDLDSGDVALYKTISDLFKETTGQKRAPQESLDGSLHAWLYAQRGIPTFATVVWGRPDVEGAPEPSGERGGAAAAEVDPSGAWNGTLMVPEAGMEMAVTITVSRNEDGSLGGSIDLMGNPIELSGSYGGGSGSLNGSTEFQGESMSVALTIDGRTMTGQITGGDMSANITAKHSGGTPGRRSSRNGDKPADEEGAAWLAYSDDVRDGAGFVDWQPLDHPTLGAVEIGGFVPLFRMNPPADELDDLAAKQAAFAVEVMGRRPKLRVIEPSVTKLADGLYEVRIGVANDGLLPTHTAMSRRARSILPTIVRISTPVERIVTGDRVNREWGLDGGGARFTQRWIVRTEPGETVTITILNEQLGEMTRSFTAE